MKTPEVGDRVKVREVTTYPKRIGQVGTITRQIDIINFNDPPLFDVDFGDGSNDETLFYGYELEVLSAVSN